jgi:hypothetical protein
MYFGFIFSALNNIIFLDISEVFILSWDELIYFPLTEASDPLSVQLFPLSGKVYILWQPRFRFRDKMIFDSLRNTHIFLFDYDILLHVKVFISDRLSYVCVFYVNNKIQFIPNWENL